MPLASGRFVWLTAKTIFLRSSTLRVFRNSAGNTRGSARFCWPSQKIASLADFLGHLFVLGGALERRRARSSFENCESEKIAFLRISSSPAGEQHRVEHRHGRARIGSATARTRRRLGRRRSGRSARHPRSRARRVAPRFCEMSHTAFLRSSTRHGSRCLSTSLRIGIASSAFMFIRPSSAAMRVSSSAFDPLQARAVVNPLASVVTSTAARASPRLACADRICARRETASVAEGVLA